MRYLLDDKYDDVAKLFDNAEDLLQFWEDEEYEDYRESSYRSLPTIYEIPDALKEVYVEESKAPRFQISGAVNPLVPRDGETASEYFERIGGTPR